MSDSGAPPRSRMRRLLAFLDQDPKNLSLIGDAATAALDEEEPEEAAMLLIRYAAISPLSPAMLNLKGLVAIQNGEFAEATDVFQTLLETEPDDPALRFNLAWCKAMTKDYEGASALLDEVTAASSAPAARLKIDVLHRLGELEDALAWGLGLAKIYRDDQALMGALATVAIDAEDLSLAEYYAARAGENHEGLAARGVLRLGEDQLDESLKLFDAALGVYSQNARARLGKGLALLGKGDLPAAPAYIDDAAELFGVHLGSWVAAGWAYFVNGDYATARARFETALAIDDTFSEIHGGLAVLDVVEGKIDSAKRRTEVALRLDRRCFSAALAQTMILTSQGDTAAAERVRNIALNAPIGQSGRTIAQSIAGLGLAARKPSEDV